MFEYFCLATKKEIYRSIRFKSINFGYSFKCVLLIHCSLIFMEIDRYGVDWFKNG